MRSFSIQNFGCRVNQAESFAWAEALEKGGLRFEAEGSRSDLVVVNSCTLTSRADRDVRKFIQRVSRENPRVRLVITGCWAGPARAMVAGLPQVLLIVPNGAKDRLPETVLSLVERQSPRPTGEPPPPAAPQAGIPFRARAPVKVQDGCDNHCTFCVIPSVRGKSVSLPADAVVSRVRDLVGHGFREVVLAGIHLSSYGRDLAPRRSLLELLREVEKVEGLGRVRLSSLDPRWLGADLRAHVTASPKVCPHFHISLQHASERVLEEMGRASGPEGYHSLLSDLRARSPEASLGADIIVGFPGETEEDFKALESFLEDSPLTYFHVFSFSPRAGTPAAGRVQVPERVKKQRSLALRRLSAEKNLRFRTGFAGRTLDAVVIRKGRAGGAAAMDGVEGADGEERRSRTGRRAEAELLTGNYFKVLVPFCPAPERELVRVHIDRVLPHSIEGSMEAS
jgi:threonylcarbamoyladenosine tRNA methylthiotransferase MtaB